MKPNSLIKLDDLNWNEEEGKHVALSEEEIEKLIMAIDWPDDLDLNSEEAVDKIVMVTSWATHIKVGHLLMKGVLSGRLRMVVPDGVDEPIFYESDT
jgi:hypothetical protein